MNCTLFIVADVFSAPTLLLVDCAVKATALLMLAAAAALLLRRDSAATRHLVWLVAMVAVLAVPLLSAILPQWRVLPAWASLSPQLAVAATSPSASAVPAVDAAHVAQNVQPDDAESPSAIANRPAALPAARPARTMPPAVPASIVWRWNWFNALPQVWAMGFCVLLLRLFTARWMLWNTQRQGTTIWSSQQPAKASHDAIPTALEAACAQLGLRRPGTLLIHPEKTIPVVWGIGRWQLLLPLSARDWNGEQLQSVLLHELAHVKRRDTLAQLLSQIACALHWFNPLVWLAAWRLGMERERACDDLVLASGVRPSAYAGHLLEVVTGLASTRWTRTYGLAMARKSSLEGRLLAVLSKNQSRRTASMALVTIALAAAVGIAVPLAMLGADDEKPPALAPQQESPMPKDKQAQELLAMWQTSARKNGDIPGGLVGRLADKVNEFIRNNTGDASGDPYAKKMAPLAQRFNAIHDWKPADLVPLLDEIAVVTTIPLETTMDQSAEYTLRSGAPLPPELAGAPWGEPNAAGLRVARPLDPQAESYPVGTPLRSRILLQNAGKEPLLLRAKSWMQPGWAARNGFGFALNVESTFWTTLGRVQTWRLAPGEFCEIATPGLGVGKNADRDEWADVRVGSWLNVGDGVDVTLLPGNIDTFIDDGRALKPASGLELKREIIREHLERELPLPASAADRELIVRRVMRDIFGGEPTPEEISALVTDKSNDPLAALGERLLHRDGLAAFVGELTPGQISFRTTPADPDAANRPKVAIGPGRYTLDQHTRLIIVGRPVDGRRTSDVEIRFWAADPKAEAPGQPYKIVVPDGFGTWAISCRPGAGMLWLLTKGAVRKIDYSNPAQVKETTIKPGSGEAMPDEFRDAVKRILKIYSVPPVDQDALLSG